MSGKIEMNSTTSTAGRMKAAGANRSLGEMRMRVVGTLTVDVIVAIIHLEGLGGRIRPPSFKAAYFCTPSVAR